MCQTFSHTHTLSQSNSQQSLPTVFEIMDGNAMYIIQALVIRNLHLQNPKEDGSLYVNLTILMRNPYGYLSAVDYPALVVSHLICTCRYIMYMYM